MKIVLLAAGRSFRMAPIADKNFLKLHGKPLIAHQLEALKKNFGGDILIIGGKHNIARLKKIHTFVREQKDLELGMAGAVLTAASWIGADSFLLISGNDVVESKAYELLKKNIRHDQGLLLAKKVSEYFPGGYLKIDSKGIIRAIVEKPGEGKEPSKLVNLVLHYHPDSKTLVQALKKMDSSCDDRYECALQYCFEKGIDYRAVQYDGFWQPLKFPWHVIPLMNFALQELPKLFPNGRIGGKKAQVAKSAKISGNVYLEDGVRVLDNAVIVGPAYIGKNTVIATNALVRGSHIGAGCVIGFGSEVARSYIGDNVWTHTNYIGDSIIGNNVSFGAGTVTGNLRLDEKEISVNVSKKWNGKMEQSRIATGLSKLGLMTGDNIRVGINTSFMPGVKIGSNSFIGAGITVAQDVPEGSFVRGDWKLKISENREKITPRGRESI